MNTFMEGTRLIVHHVLGCRTKLLVPLNDLIDSLQEVLLCHSFPSCTNCVHACLCTHTPDIGTWTTSYLHQSSSFVLRQPQTWRNGHHLFADYFHHVSLCHKNSQLMTLQYSPLPYAFQLLLISLPITKQKMTLHYWLFRHSRIDTTLQVSR
jgi:hypothetical protein